MDNNPLISVIVPVYKVFDYLDRCIDSLVNQTYQNIEIFLIDDGSPDNCSYVCDTWAKKDSRIQVIHKLNGGLSDARNAGMLAVKGEYISFIDSDDWIDLDTYSLMMKRIQETHAQIGAFNFINVYSEQISPDLSDEYDVIDAEKAIENTIDDVGVRTVAWNKVYHKSILTGLLFPKGKLHEDEFFTFRALARAERIVYLHRQCYFYFQRPTGIMGQYNLKHIDMLDGVKDRLDFVREYYPRLYRKAKLSLSLCCFFQYQSLLNNKDADIDDTGKKRIKRIRGSIYVSKADVSGMSINTALLHRMSNTTIGFDIICKIKSIKSR